MVTPWSLVERFQREAGKRILPVWGSTETAGVTLGDDQALEAGDEALGRPCAGVEVRVLDEAGGPVPEGEVGEMALRCGSLYRRLIRLDGQGEEAAPGDEHRTGDLVWRDGRGRLHFASRQDEMIKVAGLKVYPAEIEGVLRRHPAVAEAVVTADRSRSRGMVPRAHVVAREAVRPAELRRFGSSGAAQGALPLPRLLHFRRQAGSAIAGLEED
jgi:acyl-coenzyme A synthetase/AMP-(fatty) acid ligase